MDASLIEALNNAGIKAIHIGINEKGRPMIRVVTTKEERFVISLAEMNARTDDILLRHLGDAGIPVLDSRPLRTIKSAIQCLFQERRNSKPDFLSVENPGWKHHDGGAYVAPTNTYGVDPSRIARNFPPNLDTAKFRTAGDLAGWQKNVAELCRGNSRPMFSICAGFAGPLLDILNLAPIGFEFVGKPSIGKTLLLILAGSVYGCHRGRSDRGFTETLSTTVEGIEVLARRHIDGLLPFDETRAAGGKRKRGEFMSELAMRAGEGIEKTRYNVAKTFEALRTVFLITSNDSLAEMLSYVNIECDDAYRSRITDINADAGKGYGIFENLHGSPNSAIFHKTLKTNATTYFGTAIHHYLLRLTTDRRQRSPGLIQNLQRAIDRYRRVQGGSTGHGADSRITDKFAMIYAAGVLAHYYKILPWTPDEIGWAVQKCEWAHYELINTERVASDPIQEVRNYLIQNKSTILQIPNPNISVKQFRTGPGFYQNSPDGAVEFAIAAPVFNRAFFRLGIDRALGALDNAGFLIKTRGSRVSKVPVRSNYNAGREWAYRISGDILGYNQ